MNDRPTVAPTRRQQEVLDYIRRFTLIHRYQPSIAQIAEGVGAATAQAVWKHLNNLAIRGWIAPRNRKARGIQLLHIGDAPIIDGSGPIPPSEPLTANERLIDRMAPTIVKTFTPRPDFFVKITDGNAAGAGPHDLIAVELATDARPNAGTIVLIREDDQVVCRRLSPSDKSPRIEGVVVGTIAVREVKR